MAQGDYIQPRCQNLPNPEGLEEPRTRGLSRGRKRTKTKTSELGSGKSTYENSGWDEMRLNMDKHQTCVAERQRPLRPRT